MRTISLFLLILSLFAFVSCGQNPKSTSNKTRSLLLSKGASPIAAPNGLVGEYESYSADDTYDHIKISNTGAVVLTKNNKSTNELLGRDSSGGYLITNSAKSSTFVFEYTAGYRVEISSSIINSGFPEYYYIIPK